MSSIKSIVAFAIAAFVVVLSVPVHAEHQATLDHRVDTSSTRLLRARIMYGFGIDTPTPADSVSPAPAATATTSAPVEPARAGLFRARIVDRLLVTKQD